MLLAWRMLADAWPLDPSDIGKLGGEKGECAMKSVWTSWVLAWRNLASAEPQGLSGCGQAGGEGQEHSEPCGLSKAEISQWVSMGHSEVAGRGFKASEEDDGSEPWIMEAGMGTNGMEYH